MTLFVLNNQTLISILAWNWNKFMIQNRIDEILAKVVANVELKLDKN